MKWIENTPRLLTIMLMIVTLYGCNSSSSGSKGNTSSTTASVTSAPSISTGAPVSYSDASALLAFITAVTVPDDGRLIIDFQLTDNNLNAILDLTSDDFRVTVAKLQTSAIGNLTGSWQSYINAIEDPGVGPGTVSKLQATSERASTGTLTNNQNGTYRYQLSASIKSQPSDITTQAELEGLDLSYQTNLTHRVAFQFDNSQQPSNPIFDWVPSTSQTDFIFHYDVAATDNCNSCHSNLAVHGGNRTEVKYCVTCHNPGSTDANSGNSVDFKQMIHKLHRGADLPSVQAGGEYSIYGYMDSKHDYSALQFPRDIRDCEVCHAGTATRSDKQVLTNQGDNWSEFASMKACGSCHDDLDFTQHYGGQTDDNNCMSCHSVNGIAGTIASRHVDSLDALKAQFVASILDIRNTGQGDTPVIDFKVVDPTDNNLPYDILNDPEWTTSGARLSLQLSWSTSDYTNSGNGSTSTPANSVSIDALNTATDNGDGSFSVTSGIAIPDGSLAPNIAASGSGSVAIEGRAAIDLGTAASPDIQRVPITNVVESFNINEADGSAKPRREIVKLESCLNCHGTLSLHGDNRTDSIESCVTCHNPRNTDIEKRASASPPATDGKTEQTVDFKLMIHAIHAAGFRETSIQVVGFGGTVHTYDENTVHYPGELNNCLSCHDNETYTLPLTSGVLATTISTGASIPDPGDDTVISPIASVCSSCHDTASAQVHMELNGAHFSTTQADVDSGAVLEQCELCHGEGKTYPVSSKHGIN